MEGYEGYDQYLEYLDYINQYGGEIIEDNSAESCGDIISTTGTTSGTSSTFNIDIEYQTINTCTEDVDIHLIFDNSSSMSNILTKVKQAIQNYSTLLAGTNSSIKFYSLCSVDSNVMQQQISNNPLTIKKTYSLPAPTAVVNINSQMDINQISIDIASKLNTIQLLQLEKEKGMCFIARLIDEEISNQINKKTIISIVTDENDYYGQYNGYIHNYCPTANYCLKSYEIVTQNFQGIYKAKLRLIKLTGSHVINNEVKTYYSYGHFNDPSGYFNLAKYNDLLNNGQRSCTAQEKSWFENYNGVYPIDNCTIKAVTGYTYFKKPIKLKNAIGANNCGATNFTVDGVTYPNMEQYFVDTTNYPLDQYKSCYYSNISGTLNTTQNHLNYNDYANAPTISDAHINMLNNYNAQTKAKVGFSHVIYDNNNNSCTGIESANKQHGSAYLSLHQKLENNQYLSKVGDVCSTDHNPSLSQLISTTTHQVPKLKYYIPNWPPMNPQIMSIDVNLIPANGNPLPVSSQDYGISTDAQGTYILFNSNLTTVLQNYQSIKIDIEYN
jgi:hypothetical protein